MGITIHFYTKRGNHLDPATAAAQVDRAVAIIDGAAHQFGWKSLGETRSEATRFAETLASDDYRTADGTGTVVSHAWDPGDGCETFSLAWVEGTGILPWAFVKTHYAENRLRVHAEIASVLDRINREVFGGRLHIIDEGHFLPDRSLDRLAARFGENDTAIQQVLGSLRAAGWDKASPIVPTEHSTS